jgi:hypothetical protein
MTKERELLERAVLMLPFISKESRGFYPAVALYTEIGFYLANEGKQEEEPIATVAGYYGGTLLEKEDGQR